MRRIDSQRLFRIIDANFNRSKEALRVLEDVSRFFLDDKVLTRQFKDIRHELTGSLQLLKIKKLIAAREVNSDVGKKSSLSELKRKAIADIFLANAQRLKESMRVLEEFTKLISIKSSGQIKNLRYKIYVFEKKAAAKL